MLHYIFRMLHYIFPSIRSLKADYLDNLHKDVFCRKFYKPIIFQKCTPVQALRLCTGHTAPRGVVLFHDHGTRGGEGSASRPGRSLPRRKARYPLYSRLGGPQGRSGQVRKILPPPRDSIPGPSSP
jgi:hypothetical protein